MCGRTSCTLAPDEICKACSRQKKSIKSNLENPSWVDHPGNKTYTPSVNIAPAAYTPVLFRASAQVNNKRGHDGSVKTDLNQHYSIMPMRWGLIPYFFKGVSTSEFNYKTNNCRLEGIVEKKMYKPSLIKGQRCVVLCDGFYEWQTAKDSQNKQPFFIHAPQPDGIEIWNKEALDGIFTEDDAWKGPRLLMMAGLYSYWVSPQNEEIYSYTVITMESGDNFSWLHHRVPAILATYDDVENWLDNGEYSDKLSQLTNKVNFCWYKVSKLVNNSRNKHPDIIKPLQDEKKAETKSQILMSAWLKTPSINETKFQVNTSQRKPKNKETKGILQFFSKVERKGE